MHDLRLGKYAAGGTMSSHAHAESSFTIVVRGSYVERIRGRSLEHKPGSMLFYPAGEVHSQEFGRTGSHKLIFTPSQSCLQLLAEAKIPLAHAPHVTSAFLKELSIRALKEMAAADTFSLMVIEGTLLELIAAFGRMYERDGKQAAVPAWLKQCRERLASQPGVAITHQALAAQVRKHPVHLAKAFQRTYGETIGQYQRRLRLRKAAGLLQKQNMPLAEIALESGFANQAHLSRSFRCAFGMTPTQYRTQKS